MQRSREVFPVSVSLRGCFAFIVGGGPAPRWQSYGFPAIVRRDALATDPVGLSFVFPGGLKLGGRSVGATGLWLLRVGVGAGALWAGVNARLLWPLWGLQNEAARGQSHPDGEKAG